MDSEAAFPKEGGASTSTVVGVLDNPTSHTDLTRTLHPRHMAMISIGSCIGTGLFLGAGTSLKNGGPAGLLLGFTTVGSVCIAIMLCIGEMVSYLPIPGGHLTLADRFVDPAWSFALSFNYAYLWLIVMPVEMVACAIIIEYWTTAVNAAVWITICLTVAISVNFFGTRVYGEVEFYLCSVKVLLIIGLIILSIAINCGAVPQGEYLGFKYWETPFVQYQGIDGALGRFLGYFAVFLSAAFSFLGTEMTALVAAEARNPRRTVPRAVRSVFIRITLFYVIGTFCMGIIVPATDPRLGTAADASASPFVIAINRAGIKILPSIINAGLLSSALSAGSSQMFGASRALHSLAIKGQLPAIVARTNRTGTPYVAVAIASAFGCLAYMSVSSGAGKVFNWLANLTSLAGLLCWAAIAVTYLRFRAGMELQGIPREVLPFRSRLTKLGAFWALFVIIIAELFSGWTVFKKGSWDTATFVTNYLPLIVFPLLFVGKKVWSKTTWRPLETLNYTDDLDEIISAETPAYKASTWYGRAGQIVF